MAPIKNSNNAVSKTGFSGTDVGFALGIVVILTVLFMPVPAIVLDLGLSCSIALSVLILMVSLWIQRPLDFSAFPTVLLIVTMLRLSLNIATTRVILSHGQEGTFAAGHVIHGFSQFVMGGDFVIGLVVFAILIIINFVVITKGATRIAEVAARFTLDSMPGKQMAIDADLAAGLINDQQAQERRKEIEDESSFFGSMDGASKFVRGDAIAGLIITSVNIFGGIIIGVTRHHMEVVQAADIFTKLSVGDGLVTQMPALIVSLAAGLLVSKGGVHGSAEKAVLSQLGAYPKALYVASVLLCVMGMMPGLPFLPFALLAVAMAATAYIIPRRLQREEDERLSQVQQEEVKSAQEEKLSLKTSLLVPTLQICFGKQLSSKFMPKQAELSMRMVNMRRKFAKEYGFIVPEIHISEDLHITTKGYRIKIYGTSIAEYEMRLGDVLVMLGNKPKPSNIPCDMVTEPAFGMPAFATSEAFRSELIKEGYMVVDNISVLLTHLSEVIRNNLSQLFSYKDMRTLLDQMGPEYRKLLDDICPAHLSYSGLQLVFKSLLSERVSIRNLNLILEAVAEVAAHMRRVDQIVEHVRMRISSQICGDIAPSGVINVLRLGSHWETVFHDALRRDNANEVVEFDIDPRQLESFSKEASAEIRNHIEKKQEFAIITSSDIRHYIRMVIERMFPSLPILSHNEIARGVELNNIGSIS